MKDAHEGLRLILRFAGRLMAEVHQEVGGGRAMLRQELGRVLELFRLGVPHRHAVKTLIEGRHQGLGLGLQRGGQLGGTGEVMERSSTGGGCATT